MTVVNKAKKRSLEDGPGFLRDTLLCVEKKFRTQLDLKRLTVTHDSTLGDVVEDAWLELLIRYLPARYRAAKTFAVDHQGQTSLQLDCVIYDAHFTPAIFGDEKDLYVPAEAVYATFEIKQTVTAAHLKAAAEKAASVRRLKRTSAPIPWANGVNPPRTPFPITAGLLAMDTRWPEGLSKTFLRQLGKWRGEQVLDLVLTSDKGFCVRRDDGTHEIVTGNGSLMRGLFRLLSLLRSKATVVAIDWSAYEAVLN